MKRLCVLALALSACAQPGSVTVNIQLAADAPKITTPLFAFARVEHGTSTANATTLQVAGPAEFPGTGTLDFAAFPDGTDLFVVVELRETSDPTSPVALDGVSAPFSLKPAEKLTINVTLAVPGDAPDTSSDGGISYSRTPWGSAASKGVPAFLVQGSAGSVPAGTPVVIYDGPDTATAGNLGDGVAKADGSFLIALSPVDHEIVYVATLDEVGNPSQTAAVQNVTWTATFGGKTPGDAVSNPNVLDVVTDFPVLNVNPSSTWYGPLQPSTATEAPDYSGVALPGDGRVVSEGTSSSWTQWTALPIPGVRWDFPMVYDSVRGVTILFGGYNGSFTAAPLLGDTWEWNGSQWMQVAQNQATPPARDGAAFSFDTARAVSVLFGGYDANDMVLSDTWEWNGSVWRQAVPLQSPTARENASLAYDSARGVSVLFGGDTSGGFSGPYDNDTWEWDGIDWTQPLGGAAGPPGRSRHSAAFDSSRNVTVIYGGCCDTSGNALADTWEWDGTSWAQRMTSGGPGARMNAAMAFDPISNVTLLMDGAPSTQVPSADVWEWNGMTWTMAMPTGPSPVARQGHAMVFDTHAGAAMVFGGEESMVQSAIALQETWEWNTAAGTWAQLADYGSQANITRLNPAMAFDSAQGEAVVFGTCEDPVCELPIASPELWNGNGWTTPAGSAPPIMVGDSMAFDSTAGELVMLGVYNDNYAIMPDETVTWLLDLAGGTAWTQAMPGTTPDADGAIALAYDSSANLSVLYAGSTVEGTDVPSTWEWNGSNWTQVPAATANTPATRQSAVVVFDALRERTMLFSGSITLADTWVFDAAQGAWTQVAQPPATAPAARVGHAMAYDSQRGVTILYGGSVNLDQEFADTWEWDGQNWSEPLLTGANPGERYGHGMTYDSARSEVVLMGGGIASAGQKDTWVLPSRVDMRPAEIASFSLDELAASSPAIDAMTFTATVGGGGATVLPSPITAIAGATMALWNAAGGEWIGVTTTAASATAPAPASYETKNAAEAAGYVLNAGGSETVNLALFPTAPRGSGSTPGLIAVDYVEMTVRYHLTACSIDNGGCGLNASCTAVASGTQCACVPGFTPCGTTCVSETTDPDNCGSCGNSCASGICIVGSCG